MTETVKIDELTPDSKNANRGTQSGLRMLDHSLRDLGAGRSVLVDKNGVIIAGNKTIERAADLGLDEVIIVETDGNQLVAVKRTDLDLETDPKARELAYADNRISELDLDWNMPQVELDLADGIDLDWLNFTLDEEPADDPGAQIDRAEELREKWGVETGQLWQLGEHRLICGDCTDADVVGRVMDGERVDMGFFDPPYGIGFQSAGRTATPKFDLIYGDDEITGDWIPLAVELLIDKSAIYICTRWDVYHKWRKLIIPHIQFKNLIVLDKVDWSSGDLEGDYSPRHEFIFYCVKGRHKLRGHRDSNVWDFGAYNKQDYLHPTQKKVELVEYAIGKSSDTGDLVMDFFLGSGTTLIACERLSRKCRAVEISPGYCAVAIERWQQMTGQEPVMVEQ